MKSRVTLATIMLFTYLMLNGCAQSCAVGDPFSLFTYCPKDAREKLFNPKPYGAHWVKEGMTRESRREDFMACGGAQDLREGYPIKPEETIQQFFAGRREHINHVLLPCMQTKGYVYQHQCDERCLHP